MKGILNSLKQQQTYITMSVACLLAIALLFYIFTFQVRFTEKAVVTTFGKPTRAIIESGLYWRLPYPFQKIYLFDARQQVFSTLLEQIFTLDQKHVILSTYIGWRVEDPVVFLKSLGTMESAQKKLEGLVRSHMNSEIARHPFSHLVSGRKEDIRFTEIEKNVLQRLNKGEYQDDEGKLVQMQGTKSLGVGIEIFGIQRLELPEKTTEEVFNRMRTERNRIAERYRSEGEMEAKKIRAQSDKERESRLIEALAKAKESKGKADALAAQYYKIFEQNRELAIWLRKLDSLENLLKSPKLTLLLDTKTSPFDILAKAKKEETKANAVDNQEILKMLQKIYEVIQKQAGEQEKQIYEVVQKQAGEQEKQKRQIADNAEILQTLRKLQEYLQKQNKTEDKSGGEKLPGTKTEPTQSDPALPKESEQHATSSSTPKESMGKTE